MTVSVPSRAALEERARQALRSMDVKLAEGADLTVRSPVIGEQLFGLTADTPTHVDTAVSAASEASANGG